MRLVALSTGGLCPANVTQSFWDDVARHQQTHTCKNTKPRWGDEIKDLTSNPRFIISQPLEGTNVFWSDIMVEEVTAGLFDCSPPCVNKPSSCNNYTLCEAGQHWVKDNTTMRFSVKVWLFFEACVLKSNICEMSFCSSIQPALSDASPCCWRRSSCRETAALRSFSQECLSTLHVLLFILESLEHVQPSQRNHQGLSIRDEQP